MIAHKDIISYPGGVVAKMVLFVFHILILGPALGPRRKSHVALGSFISAAVP